MKEIKVSDEIKSNCPNFRGVAVSALVSNSKYSEGLWEEINAFTKELTQSSTTQDIKKNTAIKATREAYKKCGKDPNRYRPSAEALRRRLVRGIALYQIDTLVDIINLISLQTGYSIGGFDEHKIEGSKLTLGIGKENEPFIGIGKGTLNIQGLPVYRDNLGGIGTPTSDHDRTKMDLGTNHILAIINGYSGEDGLSAAADYTSELLKKYANAKDVKIKFFE